MTKRLNRHDRRRAIEAKFREDREARAVLRALAGPPPMVHMSEVASWPTSSLVDAIFKPSPLFTRLTGVTPPKP